MSLSLVSVLRHPGRSVRWGVAVALAASLPAVAQVQMPQAPLAAADASASVASMPPPRNGWTTKSPAACRPTSPCRFAWK